MLVEREGSSTSVDYIQAGNGHLVSLDSRIGVAISTDELLLLNGGSGSQ